MSNGNVNKFLFGAMAFLWAAGAFAKPAVGVIAGPILGGSLAAPIVAANSVGAGDTLYLYIDSGGGSVAESLSLMAAMDHAAARGADLRCYVLTEAESAAFWILLHCKERYALPESRLLFHHIRYQTAANVTVSSAHKMAFELAMFDAAYLRDLEAKTTASHADLRTWFDEEVEWTSAGIQRHVPGVLTAVLPVYPDLFKHLGQAIQLPAPVPPAGGH